ncbi:ATP-dependent Clp protease proteolytic subunit [Gemmatimonadota bacterium]
MSIYPPYVIERTSRGERSYDIFSRLLMDRIVFLGSPIDDNVANIIIAQLLFLDAEDPERDVYLYVNPPGGNVYSGLAVYDTMQHLRAPVSTFCVGMAASMAAVLVSAGEKGKRSALPNSRIMIHQPSSGAQGTAADIEIAAKEILHAREKLNGIIAEHTGQSVERIAEDVDRDRFMSPDEALEYGLIDRVIHGPDEGRVRDPAVAAEKIERSADVDIDQAEEEADS